MQIAEALYLNCTVTRTGTVLRGEKVVDIRGDTGPVQGLMNTSFSIDENGFLEADTVFRGFYKELRFQG